MRLALSLLSMLGGAGIAGYLVDLRPSVIVLAGGVIGLILLGVGLLLKRTAFCVAGLALFLVEYAIVLIGADISLRAALFAALFLAQCELAFWALEPLGPQLKTDDVASRVSASLCMGVGAGFLAALLMLASYVAAASAWITLLGVVAFVALGGLLAESLRRLR